MQLQSLQSQFLRNHRPSFAITPTQKNNDCAAVAEEEQQ
jgi:hypothetical protein